MMEQWKLSGLREGFLKTADTSVYPREGVRRKKKVENMCIYIHKNFNYLSILRSAD